jgi:hypothetical protein
MATYETSEEMTDDRWRSTRFLLAMAEFLGDRIGPRKQRLYAVACCRAIWPLLTDPRSRAAVEVAERFAEGGASEQELRDAEREALPVIQDGNRTVNAAARALKEVFRGDVGDGFDELLRDHRGRGEALDAILDALPALRADGDTPALQKAILAFKDLAESHVAAARAARAASWDAAEPTVERFPYIAPAILLRQARSARANPKPPWGPGAGNAEDTAALDERADLLRCLLGNPFRPVAFDPSWRSPEVLLLARAIDEGRAFDGMPVLADALEEAGCSAAEVLEHCRGARPHARGCWVLDRLLDKG